MSGDYSKWSFDARRDYAAVLMQQGRVHTDADWNEWAATLSRRLQAGTLDTVGAAAVPRTTPDGFRIEAAGGTFTIGRGRMYVDGLLAENHGGAPLAWDRRLAEEDGTAAVPYANQPWYPNPPALPQGGPHLVYLKLWQREITHVEAPALVEKALGVDTTARLQTVWQVRVLANPGANVDCATPLEDVAAFNAAEPAAHGRLTTGTAEVAGEPDPCLVPPTGGYKGLENQLYRVEIHRTGDLAGADRATFKWSRDNASVASRITAIPAADRIVVESVGRDALLRFSDGDWIEITDDARELNGEPGVMRRIRAGGGVDDATRTILLAAPLTAAELATFPRNAQGEVNAARNTRVRRWDQRGRVVDADGNLLVDLDAPGADGTIPVQTGAVRVVLEHGIVATFDLAQAGGLLRSGDYWVFAARTADASVEILDRAPPRGIHAHYAKLALVTFPDTETDCRVLWPPEAGGHGCDCTVCVTPESHASGTLTVQAAVDQVRASGGTVCLAAGNYPLREPLRVADARSVRIRGQGLATVLFAAAGGNAVAIGDSNQVHVENLGIASVGLQAAPAAVTVRRSVGVTLHNVGILCVAVGDTRSVAISLDNILIGTTIDRCVLFASIGVQAGIGEDFMASLGLVVRDTAFWCTHRGVSLARAALHFAEARIDGNLLVGCRDAAISVVGGAAPSATVNVSGNLCVVQGDGIVCGIDAARIADNDVRAGSEPRPDGDGIVLAAGLDAAGIDHCQILANRVRGVRGTAIAIRTRVVSGMIKHNVIAETGAGIAIEDDGEAEALVVENNQLLDVAGTANAEGAHLAALQLAAVRNLDVVGNAVVGFARAARQSASRAAVRAAGIGRARIAGNRVLGIAPANGFLGFSAGIDVIAPFATLDVAGNDVRRRGSDADKLVNAGWLALVIRAPAADAGAGSFIAAGSLAVGLFGERAFLFNGTRLRALDAPAPGEAGVRGNALESEDSDEAPVRVEGVRGFTFSDNRVHALRGRGAPSQVRCRRAVVQGNDLRGLGDAPVLDVRMLGKGEAAVLGNVRSGEILLNGNALPAPWAPLNPYSPE
jgi:hypothetical protein